MTALGPLVGQTTTSTTAPYTLDAVVEGMQAASDLYTLPVTAIWSMQNRDVPAEYMLFKGTVSTGTPDTLSVDTVYQSSQSDGVFTWSAGIKDIQLVLVLSTKGDLLVGLGSGGKMQALPVGTDGYALVADAAATEGVKWALPNAADADTLDGQHASAFALSGHGHSNATTSVDGFMASGDKSKLNGIEANAQVNTVTSVNSQTGSVSLTASDVGAATSGHTHALDDLSNVSVSSPSSGQVLEWNGSSWVAATPSGGVTSVNGQTGAVSLGYADVNAASDSDARFGNGNNYDRTLNGSTVLSSVYTDNYGHITGINTRSMSYNDVNAASSGHSHSLSSLGAGSQAEHDQTISSNNPSGGSNGDVWYQI